MNLRESWEWATREERKMLVRTMIQEVGCDVGSKRILWVKVNPDFEILFRLMDGLEADTGRRYWIKGKGAEVDIRDTREDRRQTGTEVKISLSMSHNQKRRSIRPPFFAYYGRYSPTPTRYSPSPDPASGIRKPRLCFTWPNTLSTSVERRLSIVRLPGWSGWPGLVCDIPGAGN